MLEISLESHSYFTFYESKELISYQRDTWQDFTLSTFSDRIVFFSFIILVTLYLIGILKQRKMK